MKPVSIVNNLSRSFNKVGLKLKKHSPEILVVAGVIGTVTSAVMACKATTKVNTILDKAKEDIQVIHESAERGYVPTPEENVPYSEEDGKKDLAIVYAHIGLECRGLCVLDPLIQHIDQAIDIVCHTLILPFSLSCPAPGE